MVPPAKNFVNVPVDLFVDRDPPGRSTASGSIG
jgi:hypothetical protein